MKALYAYTAQAYANAGFAITNTLANVWQPVGGSPFLQHQTQANMFSLTSQGILYYNARCYLAARLYDVLTTLTPDEVVTFGYKIKASGAWGTRYQVDHTALYDSAGNIDNVITHLDIVDYSTPDLVSFVEVVIDPSTRSLTGYINGKKVRTVIYPASRDISDALVGMGRANNSGNAVYYDDFYAAIFKRSEGPVFMGAWSCEDLVEVSSELRDSDGALTRNTVNESFKTVTYKSPAPGAAIAVDIKALNQGMMSKLVAVTSDGKTSTTKELTKINSFYAAADTWAYTSPRTNAGRHVASVTPADDATTLTVKLKAQFLQE